METQDHAPAKQPFLKWLTTEQGQAFQHYEYALFESLSPDLPDAHWKDIHEKRRNFLKTLNIELT